MTSSFPSTYAFFVSLMNRLLPVGIVTYRCVYTCKVSWVQTAHQRKILHIWITGGIFGLSVCLTSFSFIYRHKSFLYLKCLGREEDFYLQYKDTGIRLLWLLPLYHPFHLLSIFAFFSYIFFVPAGYLYIYIFRKKHDSKTAGISESSYKARKRKNLVTTKFNLLIWICEVVSGFVVLFPGSNLFVILYHFLPSSLSPILYYVGIEAKRKAMKSRFREMIHELKGRVELIKLNPIK